MPELKVYTIEELQEILKVTKRSIYNYIKAEQIEAVKIGKEWRITEPALKRFLERGTEANYLEKLSKKS